MKYTTLLMACLLVSHMLTGQTGQTYTDAHGNKQLCGPFPLETLQQDRAYKNWFDKGYKDFDLPRNNYPWKKNLRHISVDIYLGTWCGDSQYWVPRFVKMWDELGLDRNQLHVTALYGMGVQEKYKQGPNGEEKMKKIHRVPTFIFKRKDKEFARIVESPNNDLVTDIAQIALGYPSEPNYRGATYMMELLEKQPKENIEKNKKEYLKELNYRVHKTSELNTLGYVYLLSGKIDAALLIFEFNTHLFTYTPNVYDSYAEALAMHGETQKAIANYEKVLQLDSENKNAKQQLEELRQQ